MNRKTFHVRELVIRRVSDGAIRRIPHVYSYDDEGLARYIFFEGNWACDCNRHDEFEGIDDGDVECTDGLYELAVIDSKGRVIIDEGQRLPVRLYLRSPW